MRGYATGLVDDATTNLDAVGVAHELFSALSQNPRATEVMEGARVFIRSEISLIVVVGGGSVMDCAKGIGIVSSNKRHITEFSGVDKVDIPSPLLICVPTTAGSSADVSQFAIISDPSTKTKIAIISKALGVTPEDILELAHHAMQDVCMATNPRPPKNEEIELLYAAAL